MAAEADDLEDRIIDASITLELSLDAIIESLRANSPITVPPAPDHYPLCDYFERIYHSYRRDHPHEGGGPDYPLSPSPLADIYIELTFWECFGRAVVRINNRLEIIVARIPDGATLTNIKSKLRDFIHLVDQLPAVTNYLADDPTLYIREMIEERDNREELPRLLPSHPPLSSSLSSLPPPPSPPSPPPPSKSCVLA